jgi:hypothetical protein
VQRSRLHQAHAHSQRAAVTRCQRRPAGSQVPPLTSKDQVVTRVALFQ